MILLAVVFANTGRVHSADWHLTALDEFQAQMRAYVAKEENQLCKKEPKLLDYGSICISLLEAYQRMERRALVLKIKALPPDGGIVWEDFFIWGRPIESSKEGEKLAAEDIEFAKLRNEWIRLRDVLRQYHAQHKDLYLLRASIHEHLKVEQAANNLSFRTAVSEIQNRIQANKSLLPTGNSPATTNPTHLCRPAAE